MPLLNLCINQTTFQQNILPVPVFILDKWTLPLPWECELTTEQQRHLTAWFTTIPVAEVLSSKFHAWKPFHQWFSLEINGWCKLHFCVFEIVTVPFYTPVWKRGRIMTWQCPSVRPSVRVIRTFLQHALRYQFETWYIHSVGGMTCWVWVA